MPYALYCLWLRASSPTQIFDLLRGFRNAGWPELALLSALALQKIELPALDLQRFEIVFYPNPLYFKRWQLLFL
ncbi:MAG TPA: hypothetical protein DEF75_13510 [Comamonas kerstersii]|nr:hypothetical protein [Comamonas kerstersii]